MQPPLLIVHAQPTPTEATEALLIHAQLALVLLLLIPLLLRLDQPHALVPLVTTGLLLMVIPLLSVSSALRMLPQPLAQMPKVLAVAMPAIGGMPGPALTRRHQAAQLQRQDAHCALLVAPVYYSQLPIPFSPMLFACALPASMLNLERMITTLLPRKQVALIVLLVLAQSWDPSPLLLAVAMLTLMEMPQLLVVPALLVLLDDQVLPKALIRLSLLLSSLLAFARRAHMLLMASTTMLEDAQIVRLEKQLPIMITPTTLILVI